MSEINITALGVAVNELEIVVEAKLAELEQVQQALEYQTGRLRAITRRLQEVDFGLPAPDPEPPEMELRRKMFNKR